METINSAATLTHMVEILLPCLGKFIAKDLDKICGKGNQLWKNICVDQIKCGGSKKK